MVIDDVAENATSKKITKKVLCYLAWYLFQFYVALLKKLVTMKAQS